VIWSALLLANSAPILFEDRYQVPHPIPCGLTVTPSKIPVTIIGHYRPTAVSTVSIAGLTRATGVADIQISPGKSPIDLAFVSYAPTIYRFFGAKARVRHLYMFNDNGSGEVGIPRRRVSFGTSSGCHISYDLFRNSAGTAQAIVKSLFGNNISYSGGIYGLYRARIGDGEPVFEEPPRADIRAVSGPAGEYMYDRANFFPGGVITVNPRKVISAQTPLSYTTLPSTAGIVQLILAGALKPMEWSAARPMIAAQAAAGRISNERAQFLQFALRFNVLLVERPIDVPIELCGSELVHFLAPDPGYLRGDMCHSDAYFLYGNTASRGTH
jgi:hypothetical protein